MHMIIYNSLFIKYISNFLFFLGEPLNEVFAPYSEHLKPWDSKNTFEHSVHVMPNDLYIVNRKDFVAQLIFLSEQEESKEGERQ